MEGLLIDYDNVIKPRNLKAVKLLLDKSPKTKHNTGLILILPKYIISKLKRVKNKLEYIDTEEFTSSIIHYTYLIFDNKTCDILSPYLYIDVILDTIRIGLPHDIVLKINTTDVTMLKMYLKYGFHNPYFCDLGICVSRKNDLEKYDATPDIKHLLLYENCEKCRIRLMFDPETIEKMRKMSKHGLTINKNQTITQKELSGIFDLKSDEDLTHILAINERSIIYGDEEGVDMVRGLYGFHTHPKEAYERNNVINGWPSPQDYIGFISCSLTFGAILHIIISLEGVYIISLSDWWAANKEHIDDTVKDYIDQFDICKNNMSISDYISKINITPYKDFPLFYVIYRNWNDIHQKFSISYGKDKKSCLLRDFI